MNHRDSFGLSAAEVAFYVGTTPQKILDYETEKTTLTDEELLRYNDFFGISEANPVPSKDTLCLFALFSIFVKTKK